MINVTRKNVTPEILQVSLSGIIGPDAQLQSAVGPVPREMHVFSSGVSRINSVGVKEWIGYFTSLRAKKTVLKFHELPPHLVQQTSMISNFVLPDEVVTL